MPELTVTMVPPRRAMPEVPPAMKTVRLVISTMTSLWLWC